MKSNITIDEFRIAWYHKFDIDADLIEDEWLRNLYINVLAAGQDYEDACDELEEYLRGRSAMDQASDENVDEQSNVSRPRLLN